MTDLFSIAGAFTIDEEGVNQPFGGWFLRAHRKRDIITGLLVDMYGQSEIDGNYIENRELKFDKFYSNKNLFNYEFKFDKERGIWLGAYQGKMTRGKAFCRVHLITSAESWTGFSARDMMQRGEFEELLPKKSEPFNPPYGSSL